MDAHLPTEGAKRIVNFYRLKTSFADTNGNAKEWAWRDAIAFFQRLVISGTSLEKAKKLTSRYLAYDEEQSDKERQKFLDEVLFPALDEIAESTNIECNAIVIGQVMEVATSIGGKCSWFDGKTKLDANKYLHDLINGKLGGLSNNEAKGLLLKVVGDGS